VFCYAALLFVGVAVVPMSRSTVAEDGSVLNGTVYYVAPTGSDLNPGTEIQPWQTIQKAADTLTAGDTVYVRAGTYRERIIPQNSGSEGDHYITYAAYPGETVTIDGNGIPVPTDEGLFYVDSRNYIRISHLRVINSNYAGILVDNSSHIIVENSYTRNTASSGIGIWNSDHILVDGNEVELACYNGMQESLTVAGTDTFEVRNNHVHNGVAGYDKEGVCVKDGSSDGKVYQNHVHHTQAVGIYVDAWDKHTFNVDVFQNVVHDVSAMAFSLASEMGGLLEGIRVYNNIAYHNEFVGIWLSGCCPQSASHPMRDIKIINNTLYDNGWDGWGGGIGIENPDVQNVIIRNNICSQNLYFQIAIDASVSMPEVTVDHNLIHGYRGTEGEVYGDDYVTGNPMFVNSPGADFHLQQGSPAVDAGSAIDAPNDDFDGNSRPQDGDGNGTATVDIGAYEVLSGCTLSGDFNGDGKVNATDLQAIGGRWRQVDGPPYDCDGDGLITIRDIQCVASNWGTRCPSQSLPPKPESHLVGSKPLETYNGGELGCSRDIGG
jgi:hypothetical protein